MSSTSDKAAEAARTARMNQYYHQGKRSRWGRLDLWGKVLVACLAAIGGGATVGPSWLAWFAVLSSVTAVLLATLRIDRLLEVHTSLAVRYLAHAQDFDRLRGKENSADFVRAHEAYNQTERFEAEQEGEPNRKLLQEAYNRVCEEEGLTTERS